MTNSWTIYVALMITNSFSDDVDKLDLIQNAYTANFSRVGNGNFTFRPFFGSCSNLDAARNGTLRDKAVGTGRLIFDANNILFQSTYSATDLARHTFKISETGISSQITNVQVLTNKKATFRYTSVATEPEKGIVVSQAQINEDLSQDLFWIHCDFALPYGGLPSRCDLLTDIQAVRDGRMSIKDCTIAKDRENRLIANLDVLSNDRHSATHYIVDLEHGAIPIETTHSIDGRVVGVVVCDRFVQFKTAWMPRLKYFFMPITGTVRGIELDDFVSAKPSDGDFVIRFDQRYNVPEVGKGAILKQIDHFSFHEQQPNRRVRSTPLVPRGLLAGPATVPPLPDEAPEPNRLRMWILLGCGVAAVLVTAFFFRSLGRNRPHRLRGFTLIELLVVVAVIGLLGAILLPAVQAARESSRRLDCGNRLKQVALAVANYSGQHEGFPPIYSQTDFGGAYGNRRISAHSHSVIARALPYLEQEVLYNAINFTPIPDFAVGLSSNFTVMTTTLGSVLCPSDPGPAVSGYGRTNYRFNVGPTVMNSPSITLPNSYSGPYTAHKFYRLGDFGDGLSNTVGISERVQGDWTKGSEPTRGDYKLMYYDLAAGEPTYEQLAEFCDSKQPTLRIESRGGETWFLSGLHATTYNHVTGPNSPISACSFLDNNEPLHSRLLAHGNFPATSGHPGLVQVATMDGAVHAVRDGINLTIWKAIATRNGREVVDSPW